MSTAVQVDISGALRKNAALLAMPRAVNRLTTDWAAKTVEDLKRSARTMKSSYMPGRKSGALMKSPGFTIDKSGDGVSRVTIGTGVGSGGKMAEKYAKIQDVGGVTHPRVTAKMRKWAWFMYYKTRKDPRYKAIALTKKDVLTVRIPPSRWFSDVWDARLPLLHQRYLNETEILRVAERMAQGGKNA